MLSQLIKQDIKEAVTNAATNMGGFEVTDELLAPLNIERPKNPEHGDFAVNVSSLARVAKMPPPKIAEIVAGELNNKPYQISTVAGFINVKLLDSITFDALKACLNTQTLGKNEALTDETILLEYVSANPTGPLHIGHGRWAALGDSLVRIMRHSGAIVTPEFYVNDAGVQMEKIALSLWLRCEEILIDSGKLTEKMADNNTAEGFDEIPYPGDYVKKYAQQFLEAGKENEWDVIKQWQRLNQNDQPKAADLNLDSLKMFARSTIRQGQEKLLDTLGVSFDIWYSEKESLHEQTLPEKVMQKLQTQGITYEQDGAIWMKSTDFADEKDRVLKKSDGTFTYLTPDIAYHDEKFTRNNNQYNRIINIWGADHHGYIPRMRAALNALGHIQDEFKTVTDKKTGEPKIELANTDPRFEIILGQLVNLIIDGEKTRMGKRRKMLTLQDVVDEVGVDATRYWMVSKSVDTALDFNVELATSQTNENPVFYVQYAHARCCSILRNVAETFEFASEETCLAEISSADLTKILGASGEDSSNVEAQLAVKQLIIKLDSFTQTIADAARLHAPHIVARYTEELASDFHSFYNKCRIMTDDRATTLARAALIVATRRTLAQALELLGVSAPVRM